MSETNEMVINYVPGEECRVAVVENGKLEEFHAERADSVSHVGNIYVGKVKNVEPAIQAAFVDFGLEQNGFLHVSDLHPQYFPGEGDETTEMVGKKTPRRERPPIQECLRRGQEIAVQVLKEGVGTKGPTVTSYLSIPGRFLVMMPNMDRVGVSRKVEDEETRRKMREILDQLELPEGFGFIVRTAGMERTKAELKRDLAYLARLWKDIEKRWSKGGNKPRLLYSESDLLMRALRDMVTTDLDRIVIDDESAVQRAARFLKIVAPRSSTKLMRYTGKTPVFHAMGIEEQIRTMYSREVPLPSGGRLVIDETEALVAIDVNSGKMRDARDAETNAYRTNLEAAEEICRQLKLRDVGGIVVNDLIDMRSLKHRREIEQKFKELLKKDRARTTLEQISQFGILEMTRQRMRGSYESVHFADCPICRGRGLVQRPDSVATDAMRELAALLEHERVARIEMAVSPRIAGELLSGKRRALNRLERASGKHVEVRVSESVPVDRVTFYCYDERGADIDAGRIALPRAKNDELVHFELPTAKGADEDWTADADQEAKAAMAIEPPEPEPVRVEEPDPFLDAWEQEESESDGEGASRGEGGEEQGGRRRRRRGRGGRGRGRGGEGAPPRGDDRGHRDGRAADRGHAAPAGAGDAGGAGDTGGRGEAGEAASEGRGGHRVEAGEQMNGESEGEGGGRRRRRRRRGRGRGRGGEGMGAGQQGAPGEAANGTPVFDEEQDLETPPGPAPKVSEPSSWDLEPTEVRPVHAEAIAEGAADDRDDRAAEDSEQPVAEGEEGAPGAEGTEERRGRRRRRRGGRGRGRGRGEEQAGDASNAGPVGDDAEPVATAQVSDAVEAEGRDDAGAASGDAEQPDDGDGGEGGADASPEGSEGDGERRGGRRRRRRGRGGRGRGGDQSGPQGAQGPQGTPGGRDGRGNGDNGGRDNRESQPRDGHRERDDRGGRGDRSDRGDRGDRGGRSQQPRSDERRSDSRSGGGGGHGGGRGGDRGGDRSSGSNAPQSSGSQTPPPRPQNPAPSSNPAMPTPRVLYSSRRRLSPSERGKIKPE